MYTVHSTWHAYSRVNVHLPFIGYVDPDGGVSSQRHVIDYRRVCGKQALAKESFNMGVCWVLASSFSKLWLFSLYFRQVLILPIHARIILYKPWNQDPVLNQLGASWFMPLVPISQQLLPRPICNWRGRMEWCLLKACWMIHVFLLDLMLGWRLVQGLQNMFPHRGGLFWRHSFKEFNVVFCFIFFS